MDGPNASALDTAALRLEAACRLAGMIGLAREIGARLSFIPESMYRSGTKPSNPCGLVMEEQQGIGPTTLARMWIPEYLAEK